ncbi:MAG: hypothetical protein IAE89_08665 [Anaerolineae bacterium]|nr:hypothetical protein [Anaerolineae bacterium]
MRESKLVCPKCGQADAVRKVTSIINDGTTHTESNRIGMSISGNDTAFYSGLGNSVSHTGLASALAAPKKPSQPSRKGLSAIFPSFRLTCTGSILGLIMLSVVCSFPALYPTYRENPLLIFIPVVIFVVAAIVLMRWVWLSKRRETQILREGDTHYSLEMEQWKRALARWEELYYCYRDDGVFLPNHAVFVPIARMKQYLYAKSGEKRKREPLKLKKDSHNNRS